MKQLTSEGTLLRRGEWACAVSAAHRPSVPSSLQQQLAIHPVNTSALQSHPSTSLTNADRKRHGAMFPDHLLAVGDTRPLAITTNTCLFIAPKYQHPFAQRVWLNEFLARRGQPGSAARTHSLLRYKPTHSTQWLLFSANTSTRLLLLLVLLARAFRRFS